MRFTVVPRSWESPHGDIWERQGGPTGAGICWGHDPQLQHPPSGLSKHLTVFGRIPNHKGNTDCVSIQLPSVNSYKPLTAWQGPERCCWERARSGCSCSRGGAKPHELQRAPGSASALDAVGSCKQLALTLCPPQPPSCGTGLGKGVSAARRDEIIHSAHQQLVEPAGEGPALSCSPTLGKSCCVHTLPLPAAKPQQLQLRCPGAMAVPGKTGSPSTCQCSSGWQRPLSTDLASPLPGRAARPRGWGSLFQLECKGE